MCVCVLSPYISCQAEETGWAPCPAPSGTGCCTEPAGPAGTGTSPWAAGPPLAPPHGTDDASAAPRPLASASQGGSKGIEFYLILIWLSYRTRSFSCSRTFMQQVPLILMPCKKKKGQNTQGSDGRSNHFWSTLSKRAQISQQRWKISGLSVAWNRVEREIVHRIFKRSYTVSTLSLRRDCWEIIPHIYNLSTCWKQYEKTMNT